MTNPKQPVLKVSDLSQVGIVVRDLDKSIESLWNNFGIGPWNIFSRDFNSTSEIDSLSDMTYYGKPARFSYRAAVTQEKLGGLEIELIQPVEGDSIHRDFLREHGEGVQHLGWYPAESLEAFAETTRKLEKAGFPCIMSGRCYGIAFAYFDTRKVMGTILEMVWRDPTKSRQPNRVFPE